MSAADLTVRRATPADADTITAFNLAMAWESERRRLDEATVRSGVRRVLADPARGVYYLTEVGGTVVGQLLVTFEWSDWRDGWFWWIQSVYVHPERRGRGAYRALHQFILSQARRQGDVRGVRLYVDAANTGAQEVYRRLGMKATNYRLLETDWSAGGPTPETQR